MAAPVTSDHAGRLEYLDERRHDTVVGLPAPCQSPDGDGELPALQVDTAAFNEHGMTLPCGYANQIDPAEALHGVLPDPVIEYASMNIKASVHGSNACFPEAQDLAAGEELAGGGAPDAIRDDPPLGVSQQRVAVDAEQPAGLLDVVPAVPSNIRFNRCHDHCRLGETTRPLPNEGAGR